MGPALRVTGKRYGPGSSVPGISPVAEMRLCGWQKFSGGAARPGESMKDKEWRQQVLALFEAIERRLDGIDKRLEQMDRRLNALESQADLWGAIKERILAEDQDE